MLPGIRGDRGCRGSARAASRVLAIVLTLLLIAPPLLSGTPAEAARKRSRPARELASGRLPAAEATGRAARREKVSAKDRYIVVLEPGAGEPKRAAMEIAAAGDTSRVVPTHVYEHLFEGFAAEIPQDELQAVRDDPRVRAVIPDQVVHLAAQTIPTGIERIGADENPTANIDGQDDRVDVDVAVIDTAGDDGHPDLNVWAWVNCTDSANDFDDHGHGTHVGGTIGALDNGSGVVGVAPGARLWNIRVLRYDPNSGGATGLGSWIICGLDLVAEYASDQGDGFGEIEVANASLGGGGSDSNCQTNFSDAYHQAWCRVVAAGVTVVVAAGNDSVNASTQVPATYEEVIAVSALADSDGQPGGNGSGTSAGPDDTLADFSNYGADVDIAAPGVDILSTYPGGYEELSGTSMASPHVAGAAALYLVEHPGSSPAQVKSGLLSARDRVSLPNDPDGINEGVLNVANDGGSGDTTPPVVSLSAPGTAGSGKTIALNGSASDASGIDSVAFGVCAGTSCSWGSATPIGVDGSAPFSANWKAPKKGVFTFLARATDGAGNDGVSGPETVKVKAKKSKKKKRH